MLEDIMKLVEEMIVLIEIQKQQTKELEDMILALELQIKENGAH